MNCSQCGGPLPARSNLCQFCGALNDVDLRAIECRVQQGPKTDHPCPRCDRSLRSLNIGSSRPFYVERCEHCLGLFFDPGELDLLLHESVTPALSIDHQRISDIIEQESVSDFRQVRYVQCPVCRDLMVRKSYGRRAGVVTDVCRPHGVWLDGGELGQLLKWTQAGGLELDRRSRSEDARRSAHRSRRDSGDSGVYDLDDGGDPDSALLRGLLGLVRRLMD